MVKSWITVASDSDFTIYNLPFGIFSVNQSTTKNGDNLTLTKSCATIIGTTVIDLSVLEEAGIFRSISNFKSNVFNQATLNKFIEHPKDVWLQVRSTLINLLKENPTNDTLWKNSNLQKASFYYIEDVVLHLPVSIGNYTDFYASREHATNVGTMFRGRENALQENWLHLPVGYHGRASTVYISGTSLNRPCGQIQSKPNEDPIYGPCQKLDYELEVAAIVGGTSNVNQALTIEQAKDRIFGYVLMNDWSARDIQKWEYVPLGPFTSKNFATSISPWIVMTAALEGYIGDDTDTNERYSFVAPTSAIEQTDPVPLPYLQDPTYSSYDLNLTVSIRSSSMQSEEPTIITRSNFRNMYWNAAQQLTHHSVTGCRMVAGDLLGSGTISGSTEDSVGSLLELTNNGTKEVIISSTTGERRTFIEDGDTIILKGFCEKDGIRIGFGECTGTVLPANPYPFTSSTTPQLSVRDDSVERYTDFELYGYWQSSSTWRVRVALVAKGIHYTTIPISLDKAEHKTNDFRAISPLGQVPLLVYTDTSTGRTHKISQSLAIISLLEESFPNRPSVIPTDPTTKAKALELVELVNSGIQPQQSPFFLKQIEQLANVQGSGLVTTVAKSKIEDGMKAMELLVTNYRSDNPKTALGPFAIGTFSPTIVDIYLVPQLHNARRFNVDVNMVCPLLVTIETECLQHPWFQASHPTQQIDAPHT